MKKDGFYKDILSNFYEGIYIIDCNGKINFWNKGAERITGFTAKEVIGVCCSDNLLNHIDEKGNKLCLNGCPLLKTMEDGEMRSASVYLHHKDGHRLPVSIRTMQIKDKDEIIGTMEIFVDDSEKHEVMRNIEEYKALAMIDQLTGLPNRRYLDYFISTKYKEFREMELIFGLVFIDADNFKRLNDENGHDVGDEVLKMIARTLLAATRPMDLVGRFGGDEFVVVLTGVNEMSLKAMSERLRTLVENSLLMVGDKSINVSLSIGATLVKDEDTIELIKKRADRLQYESKNNGKNQVTCG